MLVGEIDILQNKEQKLWQDFKNGNEQSFSIIYERHYPALYAYGHYFSCSSDWVKDCIQELFSELWMNRAKIANVGKPRAYLMICLKRKILLQKQNNYKGPINIEFEEPPYESILIDQETHHNLRVILSDSIAHLTDRQREVIYLKFYAGLDYEEISKITSIKYQSLRNLLHEAIKVLKKNLRHSIL